ncbi:class I SAM-dependent methyltransferase [Bacillus solimangrovi]|uniref:SAM-dependent methyltransferase n=1 Tax=Bacillus solimangrovi TaxID=1305675 RepID=A0A1E5LKH7_9BACI|nr:class I SAM-dependent methyltransferase [Bacillus solimangrovi]OEH94528.1 SAM-dependent methyltransferase [Bacillus solimangrovi]
MNELEYQNFYDKVGEINGWDFSQLKCTSEGVKWDFYEEVLKRCQRSDVFLDIGTGGGENILGISSSVHSLVGIDLSKGMMKTAQANLEKSGVSNVRFYQMSADHLQFPVDFFDVVSCNHSPFSSTEVSKVLKEGGTFLTQQVSEADKLNLKRAFGRGQSFKVVDGTLKARYVQQLSDAGFSNIQTFEYDAVNYYQTPEDIIFLLTHTPIIPNFGEDKQDLELLKRFIEQNNTKKGIRTNSKRFMIIAKK